MKLWCMSLIHRFFNFSRTRLVLPPLNFPVPRLCFPHYMGASAVEPFIDAIDIAHLVLS